MNEPYRNSNRHEENPANPSLPVPRYTKVPVQIAHSKFDFSIDKTIKISDETNDILDIHWSSSVPKYQLNLIANRLWLSGNLHGEITYTKKTGSSIHLETLSIPWKKTCTLEYSYPPLIPLSNEKTQYEFITQENPEGSSTHFEQMIYQNEEPIFELLCTQIITTKNIEIRESHSYLLLHVHCEKEFRIWQNQVIEQ